MLQFWTLHHAFNRVCFEYVFMKNTHRNLGIKILQSNIQRLTFFFLFDFVILFLFYFSHFLSYSNFELVIIN
jgi:hypothetical protein